MPFDAADRYREPAPGTSIFNFEKVDEDEAFELVDNKPIKKPSSGPQRRPPFQQQQNRWGQNQGGRGDGPGGAAGGRGSGPHQGRGRGQQQGGFQRPQWRDQQRQTNYTASIDIRPEWVVLGDQIALSALHKLSTRPGEPEELAAVGALAHYDRAADRVTPKFSAKIRRVGNPTRAPALAQDPVIRRLAAEGAGEVFMSDALLTVLMTAPRSVYAWDVLIVRRDGKLFFDRRPGSTLEYLTNGETAPDPIAEDRDAVNGVQQLSVEATAVNQAFREQVLSGSAAPHPLGDPLPSELANAGTPPPGYRYRRWDLGGTSLVVRCEVDACMKVGDAVQSVAVHALNEFDPRWSGVDWRQKLENQRGAVLATELKNNAAKMSRWTAAALVGGIDVIKLGYVSRSSMRDAAAHVLLGTQAVKPKDFAAQMNLNMDNAWGIVRALVDLCVEKMEADGEYMGPRGWDSVELWFTGMVLRLCVGV